MLATIALITVLCVGGHATQVDPTPPIAFDATTLGARDPADGFDPRTLVRGGLINFSDFSEVLDRAELAEALRSLPLREDIRARLMECASVRYTEVVERLYEIRVREGAPFITACADLARAYAEKLPDLASGMQRVNVLRERVRERMLEAELSFLAELSACGQGVQTSPVNVDDPLEPLLLRAQWRYCCERVPSTRWGDLDLRSFCNRLSLTETERAAVAAILLEYERNVARLQPAKWRASWNWFATSARIDEQTKSGALSKTSAGSLEARMSNEIRGIAMELRVNAEGAAQTIEAVIAPKSRLTFHSYIQNFTFPELYPDGASLADLFERAVTQHATGSEVHASILETQRLWSEPYTALAEEIEKVLLKRSFDNAARGGGMQAEEETRARIANQLEQRAALNAQFKLLIENLEP